jgi:hypothetical protein
MGARRSRGKVPELAAYAPVLERLGIHDVDWRARCVGHDLVEHIRELHLVLLAGDIADVRCADDVVHGEQRMARVEYRLVLVDVDRGHPRVPTLQRGDQRAGLDGAAGPRDCVVARRPSRTSVRS